MPSLSRGVRASKSPVPALSPLPPSPAPGHEMLVGCLTSWPPPTSDFSLCIFSTVSKQRKNVISCVTVHDSPYSDSSSNTSPYSVQQRTGHNNANAFDTKGSLENHCTGNPRTIIVPPLKTQASEVLVECDSLVPGNLGPGQDRNISLESGFPVFLLLEMLLYGS